MLNQMDQLITAMAGKQMDERTLNVCGTLHNFLVESIDHFANKQDAGHGWRSWKQEKDFVNAIKGACVIAAIGRDEDTESPPMVIEKILGVILAETVEERKKAGDKMFAEAMANITAGKHTMPYDGPVGTMPLPFNTDGMNDGDTSA